MTANSTNSSMHNYYCIASQLATCIIVRDRPIMLIFYLLYFAAVLIKFAYYAQNYAQEERIVLGHLYTNWHE